MIGVDGSGAHIAMSLFNSVAQTEMMHVPYQGAAPAAQAAMAPAAVARRGIGTPSADEIAVRVWSARPGTNGAKIAARMTSNGIPSR